MDAWMLALVPVAWAAYYVAKIVWKVMRLRAYARRNRKAPTP